MRRRPQGRRLPVWLILLVLAFLGLATALPLRELDRPAEPAAKAAAGGEAKSSGTLRGTKVAPLLPVPAGGLQGFVGRPVLGRKLRVESINGNEGFWVGSSKRDRVYVEWGGDVGRNEASRFQPRQGDRVDLIGPVQKAPRDPAATLRLNAPDAQLVTTQRAFVNANSVARSK